MVEPGVIVLAVYRPNPTLLIRQLRSIVDQSLDDWRCIVGIDGPDKGAADLVRDALQGDPRFDILTFPENVGVYQHFERLLTLVDAKAPWIALADQDDYWYANKLETLVSTMRSQRTSGASCQARVVTEDGQDLGRTLRRSKALVPLLMLNEVTGCFSVFDHEVLRLALPFPPSSPSAMHDHWLGICATSLRGFHCSGVVLQDYVQHAGNIIGERKHPARQLFDSLVHGGNPVAEFATGPWEWRVSAAETLSSRITTLDKIQIAPVARGTLTRQLLKTMAQGIRSGQIPAHIAAAMSFAAARYRHGAPGGTA